MNSLEQARELHAQGFATIFQRGKSAFQPEWNKRRRDIDELERDYQTGFNVAVVTGLSEVDGKRLAVVDVDIRDETRKKAAWQALRALIGKTEPTTRTGGGGAHWWFWMPAESFPRENKIVLAQSPEMVNNKPAWTVEVLLNGHACTCAPSIHPSGKPYEWVNGRASHVQDAPASLVEAIQDSIKRTSESVIPKGNRKQPGLARVTLLSGETITPEPMRWLWKDYLAAGKLHILAGVPGTGKTTIGLAFGSALSTAGYWPDRSRAPLKNVVIWSGEDDPRDTLAPRLIAMGAEMSRIKFVKGVDLEGSCRAFDPSTDIKPLAAAIKDLRDVGLLIVDPIVSAVQGDSNQTSVVRRSLQPIVDLAQEIDCAVLGISHFTKGSAGKDPLERLTGSGAYGALPRLVMAAAKKTEEDGTTTRVLVRTKSNIGPDGGGFQYHLDQVLLDGTAIQASRISWGHAIEGTAREILAEAEQEQEEQEENLSHQDAVAFLKNELKDGPQPAGELLRRAEEVGFSKRSVQRTATRMRIVRQKESMEHGWVWRLPPEGAEDASLKSVAPSAPSGAPSVQTHPDAEVF